MTRTAAAAASGEGGGGGAIVEVVEEVAEHAHSLRGRVLHFIVRWASPPPTNTIKSEWNTMQGGTGWRSWESHGWSYHLVWVKGTAWRLSDGPRRPGEGKSQRGVRGSRRSESIRTRPYASVRGRRFVSVRYVILSRPHLLSHTRQACWGGRPNGPRLAVSFLLPGLVPLFSLFFSS